jgi:hypothetical protein
MRVKPAIRAELIVGSESSRAVVLFRRCCTERVDPSDPGRSDPHGAWGGLHVRPAKKLIQRARSGSAYPYTIPWQLAQAAWGRQLWVTGGMFSELPQIADVVRSRFTIRRTHSYCGSRVLGPSDSMLSGGPTTPQDYPEKSGFARRRERECGHRRHWADTTRRPTHAHLHH